MRRLVAIGVIACCAIAATPAFAEPDKGRADKLFDDGRKYLANKEYQLACTAFEESQKADPAIGTALNIALCYESWGHVTAAYRAFVEAERFAKLKFDDRAKVARKKIDELEPKVPHLVVVIPADSDASAIFLLDGKPIDRDVLAGDQVLEIGAHVIEVRVAGKPAKQKSVTLEPGGHETLTLEVPRPDGPEVVVVTTTAPRSKPRLYGGLALGVGGAAAMTIAGFVALAARQDYQAAAGRCPMGACADQADFKATEDARARANAMTFVVGGGAVLAAAGVYLVITSGGKKREAPQHAVITPVIGNGSIGVALGGSL